MRKFLLLILLSNIHPVHAQVKKLYGYYQPVNGGAMMENNLPGNGINNDEDHSRYFLFAEVEKGKRIMFEEIWIKGHHYNFVKDTLKQIPYVLRTSNGGELVFTDTLVKSAKGQVIQFKNLARTDDAISKYEKRFVTKTNVVIFFRYKGKLQYTILKNLKPLRPLFTQ